MHETFGKGRTQAIRGDLTDLVTRLDQSGKALTGPAPPTEVIASRQARAPATDAT